VADPTVPIAFLAGLASFLSPCVLPLVPGYLSYMSGLGAAESVGLRRSLRTGLAALAFVAGFTLVFVPLGATATLLGAFLRQNHDLLARAAGVVIIVLGLVFMGVLKVPFFYREARFHPTPEAGVWGSVLLGGAFAFGWTPCIGATMGAVLAMAAGRGGATGGVGEGALLLAVYSLGLGLPFVIAGLGVSRFTAAVGWLRRHTRVVNLASGALLVIVGVLFVTGQMFNVSIWMNEAMARLGVDFWSDI
jgi:cytochrome c-type biogenesis protein